MTSSSVQFYAQRPERLAPDLKLNSLAELATALRTPSVALRGRAVSFLEKRDRARAHLPSLLLTGVHDEHDGDVLGEDDWRGLVFMLTP